MSHYAKRWGAEPRTRGQYHFRLWAPAHPHITLVLAGRDHRMDATGDGWFEAETAGAPGDAYAFRLPSGLLVPDPASRQQQGDVHGPSQLVDPHAFDWKTSWNGRPWHETVHYEAHVGTFTPEGTFEGVLRKLDHLAALGITALELCPVAQFGGTRGWGYDGVLLYAPHVSYGTPDDLKRLVDAAHARGLMVFLDVVYNHFGPDGNYLASYAPQFFHPERHTPWGAAIAYDLKPVRDFYTDNARFWLEEYRIDGLRLDAVDQIDDQSPAPILQEIARAVRDHSFAYARHLTTEDDRNIVSMHCRDDDGRPVFYDGEWNDDFHHVAHVIATAESGFYYHDFASDPRRELLRALTGGFAYQGQASPFRGGVPRGQQRRGTHAAAGGVLDALEARRCLGTPTIRDKRRADLLEQCQRFVRDIVRGRGDRRFERRAGLRAGPVHIALRIRRTRQLEVCARAIPRRELRCVERGRERHPRRGEIAGCNLCPAEQDLGGRPGGALRRLGRELPRARRVALRERDLGEPKRGSCVVSLCQRTPERALGGGRKTERPVPFAQLHQRARGPHDRDLTR